MDLPFDGCTALSRGLSLSGPSFLTCKISLGLAPDKRTSDFNYGAPGFLGSRWASALPVGAPHSSGSVNAGGMNKHTDERMKE